MTARYTMDLEAMLFILLAFGGLLEVSTRKPEPFSCTSDAKGTRQNGKPFSRTSDATVSTQNTEPFSRTSNATGKWIQTS
ncbi:hypothetical protein HOLleu_32265 [Holothuria leucospilota]|uniref:Secreted protein n=1 Tax=Holothuria leucospilota TaxID=206669 RepID=A0A9Q0YTS2_HOLLE|nr:hypothetical protein HOLleu_32265 [Holothuria leucospilota]